MTPEEAAAEKKDQETRRANSIALLRKECELNEAQIENCIDYVKGWHFKTILQAPTLSRMEVARHDLESNKEKEKNIMSKIYMYCHGTEFSNDHQFHFEKIMKNLDDALDKLGELIANHKVANAPVPPKPDPMTLAKLENLQIPTFSGNFEEWQSFHDLFQALVDKRPIPGSAKLTYLMNALKGPAKAVISSFEITDANYDEAWTYLKTRYEVKREIVFAHIRAFDEFKPFQGESSGSLRSLADSINKLVRSLKVQGIPVDKWDLILVYMALKKLDPETRKQWSLDQTEELPKLEEFVTFLLERARALADATTGKKSGSQPPPNDNSGTGKTKSSHHVSHGPTHSCIKCSGSHSIFQCPEFTCFSVKDREEFIKTSNRCFNCFATGHSSKDCKSKYTCKTCKKRHHSLLHKEQASGSGSAPDRVLSSSHCAHQQSEEEEVTILGTLIVSVLDSRGIPQPCRVFVDNGSESHLISESCMARLGLKREKACVSLLGIGNQPAATVKGKVNVSLSSQSQKYTLPITALILPKISGLIPRVPCKKNWSHLEGLVLSDPDYTRPADVDILLSAAKASHILLPQKVEDQGNSDAPVAVNTKFGWMVTGSSPQLLPTSDIKVRVHHVSCVSAHMESDMPLQQFWELEEPAPCKIKMSVEDLECESHFVTTHTHHEDGSYTVKLPFKSPRPVLGNSRNSALNRFLNLETRLTRDPNLKAEYVKYLNQYKDLGYLEPVPAADLQKPPSQHYYVPHHVVIKLDSTTTKYRIVFDASAKTTSGVSLNQALCTGPKIQSDLLPLLIRFMSYNVAVSADIWKFYPQTRVHPQDVDFQRFLWRETPQDKVQHLRMTRLTFGLTCAPFLAIRTLHHLAETHSKEFPWASQVIKEEFLVDNLLSGADDEEGALKLQHELLSVMKLGDLKLTKWMSNCPSLVSAVPAESQTSSSSLDIGETEAVKTIGLLWHPAQDIFKVKVIIPTEETVVTKRSVLSVIARTFDPMGWLSPVTVRPKLLLQVIWSHNLDWDQPLPLHLHQLWRTYRAELNTLQHFSLQRNAFKPPYPDSKNLEFELHGFCDGSDVAYAACVYVKTTDDEGRSAVNLLTGKTKVAPIKKQSTPRSELCGAALLVNLLKTVTEALKTKIKFVHCWSDSTVVLGRINPEKKLPIFELNRIKKILEMYPQHHWNHVSSEDNPADCASRGITAQELLNHPLWLHGPSWLVDYKMQTPAVNVVRAEDPDPTPVADLIQKCSSYKKLRSCVGYWLRYVKNLYVTIKMKPELRKFGRLTPDELASALNSIIKIVQSEEFGDEIAACRKQVPVKSNLKFLTPFLDESGILRVGGRLEAAPIPYQKKHPVLLPKNHPFVTALARHYHEANLHAGPSLLLCILRDEFWIVRGPDLMKRIVKTCVRCHKTNPVPLSQQMANYPSSRVTQAPVFSKVGVDYAGPFHLNLRTGRKPPVVKSYVSLFVCMVTKAIHLELVTDLSTPAFIGALSRFTSRRGKPDDIYCDGGTNFIGTKNEFEEIRSLLTSSAHQTKIVQHAAQLGIKFHVNPPASPHHGGLWEAGVKSMKKHLRRVMGSRHMTVEEFSTLLCQVEAMLNSRPITAMSSDPNDLTALTPGHFLIGRPLQSLPQVDITHIPENRLSRWQDVQQRSQHLWKRFESEYLTLLHSRPKKLLEPIPDLAPGLLVLIRESDSPIGPQHWRLGRLVKIHPGTDDLTRICDVKTGVTPQNPHGNILRRPIVKLSPLPIYN